MGGRGAAAGTADELDPDAETVGPVDGRPQRAGQVGVGRLLGPRTLVLDQQPGPGVGGGRGGGRFGPVVAGGAVRADAGREDRVGSDGRYLSLQVWRVR
jgi:hypothetical protein